MRSQETTNIHSKPLVSRIALLAFEDADGAVQDVIAAAVGAGPFALWIGTRIVFKHALDVVTNTEEKLVLATVVRTN